MKRILLTHSGGTIGIAFAKALKAAPEPLHLIGVDAHIYSLQRALTDERYLVPRAAHGDYVAVLNSIIDQTKPDLVLALNESEIAALSKASLSVHAPLFLPSYDVVKIFQDKTASYERWNQTGVPVPTSMLIRDEKDLRSAFRNIGRPLWLRKIRGVGGNGALAVSDWDVAKGWIDAYQGWGEFMAAEHLPGHTVTWECIWRDGELIAAQGRRRLSAEFANLTRSGVTGVGGAHEWVANQQVDDLAIRAIRAVTSKPNGLMSVDMAVDGKSQLKVTEVNAGRVNCCGSMIHMFSHTINMAYLTVQVALGDKLPINPPLMNPVPQELVIIHGMDVEPSVMLKDEYEYQLEELRQRQAIAADALGVHG